MAACQSGTFWSMECLRELTGNTVDGLSEFLDINGFWIYFILGALILLIFSRDRLDRSIEADHDGEDTAAPDANASDFEKFVHAFRPSEVCMIRAFKWAWIYYAGVLVTIYAMVAFFIALALGLIQVPGEIAGIIMENLVQPSLEEFAAFSSEVAATSETVAPDSPPATLSGPVIFEVDEVVAGPGVLPVPQEDNKPLQELPLILALMAVGLLPSVRGVRQIENTIREYSLHFAGIPWQVIRLWKQMSHTPFLPGLSSSAPNQNVTALKNQIAFLPEERQRLMNGSRSHAMRLVGDSQFEKDWSALALVFGFEAWTSQQPKWPSDTIATLYGRRSLRELHRDILVVAQDLQHFIDLNSINRKLGQMEFQYGQQPGFGEQAVQPLVQEEDDIDPDAVLARRWVDLMDRVHAVSEQAIVMLALYVERVDALPKGESKFDVLGRWIQQAKSTVPPPDMAQSARSSGRYGTAVAVSVLVIGVFACLEEANRFNPFLSDGNIAQRQLMIGQIAASMIRGLACFATATFVLSFVRDQSNLKLGWRHVGTPNFKKSYTRLVIWCFFWGALLCFAAQATVQYLAWGTGGERMAVHDTFGELFDLGRWFNILLLGVLAAQVAVIAMITASICDLWNTKRRSKVAGAAVIGALLVIVAKLLELTVNGLLQVVLSAAEFHVEHVFGRPEQIELVGFAVAAAVFTLVRVRSQRV